MLRQRLPWDTDLPMRHKGLPNSRKKTWRFDGMVYLGWSHHFSCNMGALIPGRLLGQKPRLFSAATAGCKCLPFKVQRGCTGGYDAMWTRSVRGLSRNKKKKSGIQINGPQQVSADGVFPKWCMLIAVVCCWMLLYSEHCCCFEPRLNHSPYTSGVCKDVPQVCRPRLPVPSEWQQGA